MARYAEVLFQHKVRFLALLFIPLVAAAAVGYELLSFRATAVLQVQDPSSFGANFVPVGWSQSATPAENLSDAITAVVAGPTFAAALTTLIRHGQARADSWSSLSPQLAGKFVSDVAVDPHNANDLAAIADGRAPTSDPPRYPARA